jgi:hypothetical protein
MGQSISRSCRRTLRASVLVAATAALAVALAVPWAAAAGTVTRSEFGATFVNACTGELIEISGTVQERFHATFDPQGGTHTGTTITVSDVKGVGLDTGTTYVATGVFLAQTNIHQHGFVTTSVNFPQFSWAVNLISQGSADNLIAHLLFHGTLRLDGGAGRDCGRGQERVSGLAGRWPRHALIGHERASRHVSACNLRSVDLVAPPGSRCDPPSWAKCREGSSPSRKARVLRPRGIG